MTEHTPPLAAFWESYRAIQPDAPETMPQAWHFCDNERAANELGALVLAGPKRATASLVWVCEAENEPIPQAGEPLCIIETTAITITPFDEVSAEFAAAEGEGDRSLAYWRRVHWQCFSAELTPLGPIFRTRSGKKRILLMGRGM